VDADDHPSNERTSVAERSLRGRINASTLINSHFTGNWGEFNEHDRQEHESSAVNGFRNLSAYTSAGIITEAVLSSTTIRANRILTTKQTGQSLPSGRPITPAKSDKQMKYAQFVPSTFWRGNSLKFGSTQTETKRCQNFFESFCIRNIEIYEQLSYSQTSRFSGFDEGVQVVTAVAFYVSKSLQTQQFNTAIGTKLSIRIFSTGRRHCRADGWLC
jgi:hypothetical protein